MNSVEMDCRRAGTCGVPPVMNAARPRRRLDPNAPAVENIARVIGAGATARLISTFGGGRVYIAKNPGPSDAVARVIGGEAAGCWARSSAASGSGFPTTRDISPGGGFR